MLPSSANDPTPIAAAAAVASTLTIEEAADRIPQPKEEAASPAKELQFAEETVTIPNETHRNSSSEDSAPHEREGTAASAGLQEVPEEDEDGDSTLKKDGDRPEATVEGESGSTKSSRKTSVPPQTRPAATGKPTAPERRSSSRVSRSSIANLSEIIPPPAVIATTETIIPASSPRPSAPLGEEDETVLSPATQDVIPPSSESMDIDMQSIPMERDDSRDSTAGPSTTAATTVKKGRSGRKSSVPPVTAKDANKRKRTTTPQAQNRTTSPAPSDRSRSKRIKTEEPESGLGTPSTLLTWIIFFTH